MTKATKRAAWIVIAVITAPVWVPVYLYSRAMLWREDEHD